MGMGEGVVSARHATRSGDWLALELTIRRDKDGMHVMARPRPAVLIPQPEREASRPSGDSMSQMLERMALIVEARNPGHRCSILLVDAERSCVTFGAGPSMPEEYNKAVEGLSIGPRVGSCGTAVYWNVPVVVESISKDPLWCHLREIAAEVGVEACWSQPVRGSNGEVLGALALYSSVASAPKQYQMDGLEIAARMVGIAVERERLELQLRQAAKLEALGVLAGGVAHDFNNLLAVVLGNVELLLATGDVNEAGREMLRDIIHASESATSICNQMLICAGRGHVTAKSVDCTTVIRDLSKLLKIVLSKKARLRLELEDDLNVMADCSQLRQVMMNLITNGAEAVGDQKGEVVVSSQAAIIPMADSEHGVVDPSLAPGDYVEITVRDTGCGMDAKTQANIFDPFFSTKDEGRGLGLAAVMGIVKAHGWALRVHSVPGEGTAFVLLLPRSSRTEAKPKKASAPRPSTETRVLVVDDEPGVLKAVVSILEHAGMEVRSATNGAEAVEIYREHHRSVDCVVLDLNMPVLDGAEAFQQLKAIREDVIVLLSSGYPELSLLDQFQGAGLSGILQKPIRASTLLGKIAEAVAAQPAM